MQGERPTKNQIQLEKLQARTSQGNQCETQASNDYIKTREEVTVCPPEKWSKLLFLNLQYNDRGGT